MPISSQPHSPAFMPQVMKDARKQDRPPLLGLALRLANDGDATTCERAADAACDIASNCSDPAIELALTDTLRGAVLQHSRIAEAVAVQCQKRLRSREPGTEAGWQLGGSAAQDADMCLHLLQVPTARGTASQAIVRAVSHGVITKEEVGITCHMEPLPDTYKGTSCNVS